MTNWTTAAGLALLAGGLATLITLRAVLFGAGDDDVPAAPHESGARAAAPTQVILSWPPVDGDHIVNAGRAVFTGGPGERPTVMEKRRGRPD